ncbi:MAG: T9SS type A sorting domain-containing protein [Candidatus Krumholzibacteria bacterium]|nr:T9SS type A sorting domain-containing protein [Candidatus Krumholzibacteria bacterium]
MQRLSIPASLSLALFLIVTFPGFATGASGDKSSVATLVKSGPVTSPSSFVYRWADLDQNSYAQTYVDAYSYDDYDVVVTVTYETGEPTFTGHLSAVNLKPNFAYQLKLVGKPTGSWGTEGDDATNERIGYAGRWWEVAPGTGNRDDTYYEAHKNDSAYIFEAYLLFDFFLTDPDGNAELDFALDSSYHVLFWDWQGSPGSCDKPMKTTTVSGLATDPAYDTDVGPTGVGVYPQIQRLCNGLTVLPQAAYNCRILLTEESFHTSDGGWAPAMVNNDIEFNIGAGLFPPAIISEPAFTPGSENMINWNSVSEATQYYVESSTSSDFSTALVQVGPTGGLFHTFVGLLNGQTYYYHVKASNGTKTDSAWSSTVSSTQDDTAPISSVGLLPSAYTGSSLSIPFMTHDAIGEVDFVELYYRVDLGSYARYGGTFSSSPINFIIPGDGDYDFYTMATDKAGNEEVAPNSPDASSTLISGAVPDPVGNPDYIDIGTLASENQTVMGEAPHNMVGWGPTAPGTIGGGYGGIAPGSCRPVWSPTEFDLPHEPWADIDLDFGPVGGTKTLWVRYLDGTSLDDQSYYIDSVFIGSIATGDLGENWHWYSFDVSGYDDYHTLRIEATKPAGTLWTPYGQVAIDIISICGAEALFEALPVDANPIACGGSKAVNFHFTQGCEYIRGYTMRVRSSDGLSFNINHVTVHDLIGPDNFTSSVTQTTANDWTITYSITDVSALPFGIPSDSDLFTIDFQGAANGAGQVIIESVAVVPILLVPEPVLNSVNATIIVDCAAPTGGFQINGGATATNDLDVNLNNAVTDATLLQMRFANDPDGWSGSEDGWVDYAEVYFWTLASGDDGARTVYAQYRDAMGLVLATNAAITYSTNGPTPVTALAVEPGNLKIVVTWQDPPDLDLALLEVWRGLWYDDDLDGASAYPEYSGLASDVIPTRPVSRAGAFASPQWELAGTVQPGNEIFTDVDGVGGLPRGIYYYEVFALDTEGFYGPRPVANVWATSYLLGDIDGDGKITVGPDITGGLSLCYGTTDTDAGWNSECDVGPTDNYSGTGIPLPDDQIEFDDLMIYALNFDTELNKTPVDIDVFARFLWTEVGNGTWSLSLVEHCADLKGLNLQAGLPSGAVLSLSAGKMLAGQDCPVFLRNIDRNGLDAGLALLSDGARISGNGELLRVTVAGGHVPAKVTVEARNSRNTVIPSEVETASANPEMPVMHRAFPNYPNPFNPSTRIDFELPKSETVELSVFGLDGRRVVKLVDGVLSVGRHTVIWKGRDENGGIVASGTYFYRLKAGAYTKTCKMTLLK